GIGISASIKRSWDLSKGSVGRILGVLFIATLVTLPANLVLSYPLQIVLEAMDRESLLFWVVYAINLSISIAVSIFFLPFWQSLKGVIYYDLQSRREGFDLKLSDR
ncbi:MAG: hypothetical protein AAFX40_11395, partial [Cyanobacteria bacterium J06639_1]